MLFNPPDIDFPKGGLKRAVTRYVIPGWGSPGGADQSLVGGYQYFVPIFVGQPTTYIRIGCKVSVLEAGKSARLGILEWSNGLPGAVILDAGTVSLAAVAAVEITIAQMLSRGFYFLTLVDDSTGTVDLQGFSTTQVPFTVPIDGYSTTLQSILGNIILTKSAESAQVAAGLTDPAPTPDGQNIYYYAGMIILREN